MLQLRRILTVLFVLFITQLNAQFRNTYSHTLSDDHISLIKKHDGFGYVQCSTVDNATKDIRLVKYDLNGVVMLDEVFTSPSNDDFGLDVCLGNSSTFLVCGYETIGGLDRGFVMQVDSNFVFQNKVYIQVPANNKHTPALKIINSKFYEQNTPGNYWPGDPSQGYLVVGFEADGYNATQSKSAYAIKMTNALTFQWARKFDSPISVGTADWDMCSNANWMWVGSFGYLIGGSGTSPSGEQCGMATLLSLTGTVVWSQLYADNNATGTWCVSADGAFDDAEFEFYHLLNCSQTQSGGIVAMNQFTGAINPARTRYLISPNNDYYTYEFASSCASSDIYISGYGHNQISGTTQGIFPFVLRYNKNTPWVDQFGPHYAYPTQSINYNPSASIFSTFSTTEQPRIYYPKHLASRIVNIWSVAGYEDQSTFDEDHLIHPYFDGKDSCSFIDPQIQPIPMQIYTHPLNNASTTYNLPTGTNTQSSASQLVYNCCPIDANFTYSIGANCTYTFSSINPPGLCAGFIIYDPSYNLITSGVGNIFNYTFTQNGTYIVCYHDCAPNGGTFCRRETCQTINVTCALPCGPIDADFTFTISGCTVSVTDLTPDGDPDGCESWTFGNLPTVYVADATSITFPGSGTYTICHVDCCRNTAGVAYYHTVCKTVTVTCTPPCCLPTNFNVTGSGCCRTFTPVFGNGACSGTNFFWNFGDGNFSWSQNPTHCFNGSGIYTITMIAWCSKTQKILIKKTIKIKCALPPPPPCCTGTSRIAFTSSGLLLSAWDESTMSSDVTACCHSWSWGDGSSTESANASHYYQVPGTYEVSHTVTFTTSTGESFQRTATQNITVNQTPPAFYIPDHVITFAGASIACDEGGTSIPLFAIDYEGDAEVDYRWYSSNTPGGPYSPVPNGNGKQVWVHHVQANAYFVCYSTSRRTGATFISDEVSVTYAPLAASSSISDSNICVGGFSDIAVTAPDAISYDWSPNVSTTSSATVTPTQTTTYDVFMLNTEGCGAWLMPQIVVDNCVVPPNNSPATASQVAYSSNVVYPNCYPISGDLSYASDSPESASTTGPDTWYKFVAQSTGVSITLNSPTSDDVIELYQKVGSNYIPVVGGFENAASGAADYERLNHDALTPGTTYYVSVGTAGGTAGPFTLCIQHLMPSGCSYVTPPAGFSVCGSYKAIYRGSPSSGVTYDFHFTGIGGGAPAITTTLNGTNGLINLSSPTLALQYGGVYDVSVDVNYSLSNGAGSTETIHIAGNPSSVNCSDVTMMNQPLVEVKSSQRCPAALLRTHYLIGKAVPGHPSICGAINYTYEFTQVTSCLDNSPISIGSTEYTTPTSAPYLSLGVLQLLGNTGVWSVKIRPNFASGPGVYGPAQLVSVNNTSASVMYPGQEEEVKILAVDETSSAMIYPNPGFGEFVFINTRDVSGDLVHVTLYDAQGRLVQQEKLVIQEQSYITWPFQVALSNGVYYVKINADHFETVEKLVVNR